MEKLTLTMDDMRIKNFETTPEDEALEDATVQGYMIIDCTMCTSCSACTGCSSCSNHTWCGSCTDCTTCSGCTGGTGGSGPGDPPYDPCNMGRTNGCGHTVSYSY